jgi:hypothetical protein
MVNLSSLILILIAVESGGEKNPNLAVGDNGRAVGCLQIHESYWREGCEFLGKDWPLADRTSRAKSVAVTLAYLRHYGAAYERRTGRQATIEVYSRIHNAGPAGWRKPCALKYWHRVQKEIKKHGQSKGDQCWIK